MDHREHILLRTASSAMRSQKPEAPQGCHYDPIVGAWILDGSETLLVETSDRSLPRTKKNDIETGEDQKGE